MNFRDVQEILKKKYLPLVEAYGDSMHTAEAKEAFFRADCEIEALANGTEPDYSVKQEGRK